MQEKFEELELCNLKISSLFHLNLTTVSPMAYETVFVVGAGASMPYNMPSGAKLRTEIESRAWLFSHEKTHQLRRAGQNTYYHRYEGASVHQFFTAFKNAPQESIDRFLAANPNLAAIGKICIADCLLEAEQKCTIDDRSSQGHWLQTLFNQMNLSYHPERLDGIAFVTFNYDRLIERYFEQAFQYAILGKSGLNELLKIVHVHGSLGEYPTVRFPRTKDIGGTGTRLISFEEVEDAAENIQIIHETQAHVEAKGLLQNARKIVFLGFSYAEENMKKIWPWTTGDNSGNQVLGTAFHLYDGEVEQIPFLDRISKLRVRKTGNQGNMGGYDDDWETFLRKHNVRPKFE